MTSSDLYQYIDDKGYTVFELPIKKASAIAIPDGSIGLDPAQIGTTAEEKALLAHELGHLETGTFYGKDTSKIGIARCEERANRWAYRRLIPPTELGRLLADSRDIDEISEHFDVPPEIVCDAYRYYQTAGIELTAEETAAVEELAQYELVELSPTPATASPPPQEATAPTNAPEPTIPAKAPEKPRWGFVRRGYLLLFDEVLPGDKVAPGLKTQPPNAPICPAVLNPAPKKSRLRNIDIDLWK